MQEATHDFPVIQKKSVGGYDGKGVVKISSQDEIKTGFDCESVIEECLEVEKEISVIVARNTSGEIAVYDPVEMVFDNAANILDYLLSPAQVDRSILTAARRIALEIIQKLNMIGILAVEFIIDKDSRLLVNELAPRPHNSGHHTIEAAVTSQYEQHLRAICGLPLGDTSSRKNAAMLNILGEPGYSGRAVLSGLDKILGQPDIHWHWYAKKETRPGRKMGHVTALADDLDSLIGKVEIIKKNIRVYS